ncbi:MAG: C4-type zinc ribbon domain-containing protein [bacterium]|nr:C4-type zinc ribbon domain-containing protein [bacterium]MDE0667624.1 C4-type zinc ribbon domain-containing protein [bacterium]MXZ30403.1 hypothetical protein [Acidimicrobiia bacterium]MYJ13823.1 hypothetical protein [Acidimicrobiia bacterium]
MNPLERLLELQSHDTRVAQLEHRHAQLPERAELLELERQAADLDGRIEEARARQGELNRLQRRYDDDLTSVVAKRDRERTLLYSGEVTGIRELQSLEEEVAALGRRQRVVEDKLLEVMEELETAGGDLAALEERRSGLAGSIAATTERLAVAAAGIDGECERVRGERAAVAQDIAADLLARYERLRPQFGGVAVARLEATSCLGCQLTLPLMDVDRLRRLPEIGEAPPGEDDKASATCPSCGRILVI